MIGVNEFVREQGLAPVNQVRNEYRFIDYEMITCSHTHTHIYFCRTLSEMNLPVYHIPTHLLGGVFLTSWRNASSWPKIAKTVTAVALIPLVLLGVIDAIIRIILAAFAAMTGTQKLQPRVLVKCADFGLQCSWYFAIKAQRDNWSKKNLSFV